MFAGLEFCIVNGPSGHPKAKLEKSIAEVRVTTTKYSN